MSIASFFSPRMRSPHPEDRSAQQATLKAVTVSSTTLSLVGLGIVLLKGAFRGDAYLAAHLPLIAIATSAFLFIFVLSRRRPVAATILTVSLYLGLGLLTLSRWSIFFPTGWLLCVLAILIATAILGAQAAVATSAVATVALIGITYKEIHQKGPLDLHWTVGLSWGDLLASLLILAYILLLAWISSREVERSLKRALSSEARLLQQRDELEQTVELRTRELRQTQREETIRLYEFAEFGKFSSGLLHDLVTPLSTISHTLKRLDSDGHSQLLLNRALAATARLERFISLNRKQVQQQRQLADFIPASEIDEAIEVFSHKIQQAKVTIEPDLDRSLSLYGDPIKFHRLASNLIANAIGSYAGRPSPENRRVIIRLFRRQKGIRMTVEDFGCGMSPLNLKKAFDPFFTTKDAHEGTGIGLSICKEIAEKDFGGTITLSSTEGKGTRAEVRLFIHAPTIASQS